MFSEVVFLEHLDLVLHCLAQQDAVLLAVAAVARGRVHDVADKTELRFNTACDSSSQFAMVDAYFKDTFLILGLSLDLQIKSFKHGFN